MPGVRAIGTAPLCAESLSAELALLRLQSSALTATANAVVITDRDGAIVWVNPAFVTLTGYTLQEAVKKNPRDLLKSGKHELALYQDLWKTILAGHVWHGELVNRRKDGSLYSEEQTITPLRDAAGDITHFIAVKQDLSERRRAEADLRLFRTLVDQSNDSIEVIDPVSGRFLDVNENTLIERGYSRVEYLSLRVFDLDTTISESMWPRYAERLQAAGSLSGEGTHRRKDGTVFPIEYSARWVRHDRDYIVTVVRDITMRKAEEKAFRDSEERYRLLFENSPLPMWLYDPSTLQFLDVNESSIRHYGFSREEFLGMNITQIRPKEDISALHKSIVQRLPKADFSAESRHCRKDGSIIHVQITMRPMMFDGRNVCLVLSQDITERKQLEARFLQAQRLESLGMLAAGVAHDLNNVLSPIIFAAPMLRASLSESGDLKILDTLESSAARGAGLVKQILGFAHGTTGELRPTQVKHLLRDVIDVIELSLPKSIRVEHHIPSGLWLTLGNPTHIHQVLLNLCVNARDAMPQGGTLRISAANRHLDEKRASALPGAKSGDWLFIEIADTGTGIPADLLPRIWEPFFTTKAPGKGTGLGLSTVRGIVASHGGFIALDTEPGKGTSFGVYLPATLEEASDGNNEPGIEISEGDNELILVVDDDQPVREMVSAILRKHNYRVLCASDGMEAIRVFNIHAKEVALVVTDIDMPNLGGVSLARILTWQCPDLRLLVMSGLAESKSAGFGFEGAIRLARAFLQKPFTQKILLKSVHELLKSLPKP